MARRFERAKEFIQSDRFGNVVDFFQESGIISGGTSQPRQPAPIRKPDYTPLYILGAIAVLVAIIKK
jgi:hypothetical protein